MKKILFLLVLVVAIGVSVSAQTYEEVKSRTSEDISVLEKNLERINSRIFYLEVTLDQRIAKAKNGILIQLQKEKHFAPDELIRLKDEKKALESTISKLKDVSLVSISYRAESDKKSNLPEEMGPITYKRRVRAQIFKERVGAEGEFKKYPGLLVNLKQGLGELTTFKIYPKGIREVSPLIYILNPQERLVVDLAPGDYEVEIISGQYVGYLRINVDPAIIKHADGKSVYWSAIKLLSDW